VEKFDFFHKNGEITVNEKFKKYVVSESDILLNLLCIYLKDMSKKDIKKLLKFKQIAVDGCTETNANKTINVGSEIIIYFSKKITDESNIKILYEDLDIIVIDKPTGLLSISTSKETEDTAYQFVSNYLKKHNKKNKVFVVHRLDRDTSGVLLFAKNETIKNKLQDNWNELVKCREYYAVVEGVVDKSGTIKSYLVTDNFNRTYSTKNKSIGKLAITHYEPIKSKKNRTLLKVLIDTGRKNQIRVHLSELGFPIIGDKKYGSRESFGRLALHSSKLHLIDPRNNKLLKFESTVPKSIMKLID